MIVVVIVVVLVAIGAVVAVTASKKKGDSASSASQRPATTRPTAAPSAKAPTAKAPSTGAPGRGASTVPPSARDRVGDAKAGTPTRATASGPVEPLVDEEPDLSRFGGASAAPKSGPAAPAATTSPSAGFRYPMEASLDDLATPEPEPEPEPAPDHLESFAAAVAAPAAEDTIEPPAEVTAEPEPEVEPVAETAPAPVVALAPPPADDEPEPSFDLERVLVAPLFGSWTDDEDDDDAVAGVPEGGGATVTRLEPRPEPAEAPLAEIVADLIDAADPEVAEVMARLIDSSDPDLVARLVDADDLEVAEVVAKLLDAADDDLRSMVVDLADAPDRRQVAEVLKLVDAAYAGDDALLSPEIAEKLEELDIENDLELTSRPAEMAQFARLENKDQLRVIIRVLCGLVAREDLPRSPRMPAVPASSAENRRWPLSRARWPVPPPDDEDIVKRAPLPARRADTKAS
jgi:hypothetical protein